MNHRGSVEAPSTSCHPACATARAAANSDVIDVSVDHHGVRASGQSVGPAIAAPRHGGSTSVIDGRGNDPNHGTTVASAETAPLGVASTGSDAKHDRDVRRYQARIDHLQHNYDHHSVQCMRGEEDACEKARVEYGEMQDLRPLVSAATR